MTFIPDPMVTYLALGLKPYRDSFGPVGAPSHIPMVYHMFAVCVLMLGLPQFAIACLGGIIASATRDSAPSSE